MSVSLLQDVKTYKGKTFWRDFIAGLTVAVILIPQGMAYSLLAGLDPVYGLYAALVPLFIYPLFASSRELSVGPVALMSIILLGGVSAFAKPGTQEYLDLVLLTALLSGIIQVIFSILRLGSLSNFLSRAVMSGFISAAGVIIAISQLKYLFSLNLPRRVSIVDMVLDVGSNIGDINWISFGVGSVAIGIIILTKKIHKAFPSALIVVILGSIVLKIFNLADRGVPIVGDMPSGLPDLYLGFLNFEKIVLMFPTALVISLVCFVGSYSIANSLSGKGGKRYPIIADKELLGLGIAKILGSFFLAMPSTGSFTRSAINAEAGAKTGISSIIAAIFLALTIAFFGGLFYYLPEPILAAIVITSVFSLIDIQEVKKLFHIDRHDFWVLLITFFATLFFGIVNGIKTGIAVSLVSVIYRSSKARTKVLGRLPKMDIYRNVRRFDDVIIDKEILILRYSQTLFFGNAGIIFSGLKSELKNYPEAKIIIISMPIHTVPDGTATYEFEQLIPYCRSRNLRLIFTDINGPVRDYMHKTKLFDLIEECNFFLTISDAVGAIKNGDECQKESIKYSEQTDFKY